MTDAELLQALENLRDTMIDVATGGPRINDVNQDFQSTYAIVAETLAKRGLANPLPYSSLWDWYSRWSSGDLPTWQSRREFVGDLFNPLIRQVQTGQVEDYEPTGWARVDRCVSELRNRLASASIEEQFQAVGLLCREALISLGQATFDPERHPSPDDVAPSETDAKRMLEAFVNSELAGGSHKEARKHARSALDLAVHLQHRRTAGFRDAALCVEATTSVINIIAIVSGRRDPQR